MIIVKIKGGLGNQMFQYALGRRLSLDWSDEVLFDFSWFDSLDKSETVRKNEISDFNVVMKRASENDILKVKPSFFSRMISKIKIRFNKNYFFTFHPSLLKKRKNIFLDGYFQSYKYFDSIRQELLASFVLKNGLSGEVLKMKHAIETSGESVAVHVRRGDYVSSYQNWHGLCSVEYYQKAFSLIKKEHPHVVVFVFSDDIEWAKVHLTFDSSVIFVSQPHFSPAEELFLMSLCKHHIIANSTFSWWAAWLNKNDKKIVVTPRRWLAVSDINTDDLLPPDWIKI